MNLSKNVKYEKHLFVANLSSILRKGRERPCPLPLGPLNEALNLQDYRFRAAPLCAGPERAWMM